MSIPYKLDAKAVNLALRESIATFIACPLISEPVEAAVADVFGMTIVLVEHILTASFTIPNSREAISIILS